MTRQTLFTLLLIYFGISLSSFRVNAESSPKNMHQIVQDSAAEFVENLVTVPEKGELVVSANKIDERIKLSECPEPLDISVPGKQQLTHSATVLVRCEVENWQLYVPVKIELFLPRVVATHPLGKGQVLAAGDLDIKMLSSRYQRGTPFTSIETLIGAKAKRNIRMGEAVESYHVCLVCRNDAVIIKIENSNLRIMTKGTALSDGALGEQIRVQNSKSKRIIDANVTAVGEVSVNY